MDILCVWGDFLTVTSRVPLWGRGEKPTSHARGPAKAVTRLKEQHGWHVWAGWGASTSCSWPVMGRVVRSIRNALP